MKKTIWPLLSQLCNTAIQEMDRHLHGDEERMIGASTNPYYTMKRRLHDSDDTLFFLRQMLNIQYDVDTGAETKMFRIWEDVQDKILTEHENRIRAEERGLMTTNLYKDVDPAILFEALAAGISAFLDVLKR